MDTLSIVVMALALSLDALAVSVSNGLMIRRLQFHQALRIAVSFGLFQALMPVLGWAAGYSFRDLICAFDHWIALGLLAFIGVRMIIGSLRPNCKDEEEAKDCRHLPTLLLMALATSIDALAVGIGFACLAMAIMRPVLIIGGITFIICLAGVYFGNCSGHCFKGRLELAGGVILIGIGVKIAVEHLVRHL